MPAPLDEEPPAKVWSDLEALIARYLDAGQGFTARRAMLLDSGSSDYDDLSRLGEWSVSDKANSEEVS